MARHVDNTPYLLAVVRPRRTVKGPKQLTPASVNGGFEGVIRSSGRLAIFCALQVLDVTGS